MGPSRVPAWPGSESVGSTYSGPIRFASQTRMRARPLGSGFADSRARRDSVLQEVADRHGVAPARVSLAWLLQRSPNVLLIPGTSKLEHLEENTAAGDLELSADDLAKLDDLVAEGEALEEAH